ncbi:uncharacterized protein LOC129592940 isoform X2 [Paramacrobiotus metropolitanus]|uniref:uncharacterized protein LOC129592940 isoform X2 n=1 Tax=Paramacrobiotus metropolitanus TaxID=2943436 RepID=UPI0024458BAE|nr:uncharacterized protein LOC129592940 isoform X2 [Paramacrobiotus metropolitanus]
MEAPESDTLGSSCMYQYDSTAFIARGRFGIVYRGNITGSGGDIGATAVAVKVTHLYRESDHYSNADSWRRLRDRWTKLLTIRHSHLLNYHKISINTSTGGASVEFLMEYCNGGDLANLLSKVRTAHQGTEFLRPTKLLCYALQICSGLEFLHEHKIIHGDLKPANILRHCHANHDRVLIGDLDDFTQMHHTVTSSYDIPTLRGSIRYMSPEMLRKFGDVPTASPGRATDIWSFGCILHELLNCSYGADKQVLHMVVPTAEGSSVAHYCHIQQRTNDNVFAMNVMNGAAPYVNERVPSNFRELLVHELFVDSNRRLTAAYLKSALIKIAWELCPNYTFTPWTEDDQDCICRNNLSRINNLWLNKHEKLLFIHKLYGTGVNYPGSERLTFTVLQLYDPVAKKLREVQLPGHPHSDCHVLSSYVVMGSRLFFQVKVCGKFTKESVYIMAIDILTGKWSILNANFAVKAWYRTPMAIGNRIYSFETPNLNEQHRLLNVAAVDGDNIVLEQSFTVLITQEGANESDICELNAPTMAVVNDGQSIFILNTALCIIINASTGEWEFVREMPAEHQRLDYACAVMENHVYITGGMHVAGKILDTCVRIDSASLELEPIANLRRPRQKHGAFVSDGRLYVFGGCTQSDPSGEEGDLAQTMEVYNPETNIWEEASLENLDKRCYLNKKLIDSACFRLTR